MIFSRWQVFLITILWLIFSVISFYLGYQKGKYDIELSQVSKLFKKAPLETKETIIDLVEDFRNLAKRK